MPVPVPCPSIPFSFPPSLAPLPSLPELQGSRPVIQCPLLQVLHWGSKHRSSKPDGGECTETAVTVQEGSEQGLQGCRQGDLLGYYYNAVMGTQRVAGPQNGDSIRERKEVSNDYRFLPRETRKTVMLLNQKGAPEEGQVWRAIGTLDLRCPWGSVWTHPGGHWI